ncbi:androgen-dependent TFPI-regulating protein-like [Achroia grisella]|uniref:androgen-dependent TFPI-regulating protein-like n=1 Tax=Achroia grisella TaxID=688607 RepID=UPI0027D25D0B|nr:androgen-dependent TFPI-regulating protein-like [Achroia grisella]
MKTDTKSCYLLYLLFSSTMDKFIYYRLIGYLVTLCTHLTNLAVVTSRLQQKLPSNPELTIFLNLQYRYLTIWTTVFQVIYAIMGLVCDTLIIIGKKSPTITTIRDASYKYFSAIVLPFAVLVFTLFWPIYFYDKPLVFPPKSNMVICPTSNIVFHAFILPVVVWELVFQPKKIYVSHTHSCVYILLMYVIYNTSLFYTRYGDYGVWPYLILKVLEGTIFFPLFFIFILFVLYTSYFTQSHLKSKVWEYREKIYIKEH